VELRSVIVEVALLSRLLFELLDELLGVLPSAKTAKILGGLRRDIVEELDDDPTGSSCTNCDVEEYPWVLWHFLK